MKEMLKKWGLFSIVLAVKHGYDDRLWYARTEISRRNGCQMKDRRSG